MSTPFFKSFGLTARPLQIRFSLNDVASLLSYFEGVNNFVNSI